MGGVDIGDSTLTHYPSFRKYRKWYKKLFFGIMDIVLLNHNVLYDKQYRTKTPSLQLKKKMIEQFFENYASE